MRTLGRRAPCPDVLSSDGLFPQLRHDGFVLADTGGLDRLAVDLVTTLT